MNGRAGLWGLGLVLLAIGVFMPQGWYEALPTRPEIPERPFSGVLLLQACFVLEGLVVLFLAWRRWRWVPTPQAVRFPPAVRDEPDDLSARSAGWWLVAISAGALALRLYHINGDLWLDEITPILDYGQMSALEVFGTYFRSNNHLLNTLLGKAAMAVFGEAEWVVRIPAVAFGVATVPAVYWLCRMVMSRRGSLGVALLLAVSYHHIFFSQNARGYTGYILFSLLATGLLARALADDRPVLWALYVGAMALNFTALLHSGFVFASHILVGAVAVLVLWRRGVPPGPLARRLVWVFGLTSFVGLQLYATALPQVLVVISLTYGENYAGYNPFSLAFLSEMIRGIAAGFGPGFLLGAVPFLAVGLVGFVSLARRGWTLMMGLAAPTVVLAAFLAVRGLAFSPRFFILALPVAIAAAVEGLGMVAAMVARRRDAGATFAPRLAMALVGLAAVASAWSLMPYYRVPKQSYRASLEYVESRRSANDLVVVIYLAERGVRYYADRLGIAGADDYVYLRSDEDFVRVQQGHPGRRLLLVTTFNQQLGGRYPELTARIRSGWRIVERFPGSVGDGTITVWEPVRTG